ncbi:XVIPCD domain-containing protein [Pseudoxanthomonas wuyuanensis]|nr:XVIPCD domain-containing protein [Pseudoxanthomonas wuyuanensis]KAF1718808.1 hypothetical protein CSC75_18070 [Pseudoxanthomonas wuyuanensis]
MEVINEPLVKIVPAGDSVSPYSPFFARRSEFEDALAKGHNLSERFGLPIKSEATVYDVHEIRPKGATEVFVSRVAPTSELGGQVAKAGGAEQYLVPNRGLFTEATHVTSIGNDLTLHRDLVVSKGLGAPIVAAEAVAARGLRGGTVAKGLGAAGVVVTAYDAADTLHDVSRLRAQGNATAAQAQIERFAIQNAAGWSGAAAGVGLGAAAGVETGPGLLITGALGGVVGAVAGDKVSDWINERKINRQQDPQGNTWTFDPDHSERGWTRTQRDLDVQAMSATTVDMPIYKTRTLAADAELSDRLTWQASRTSIELALGSPPRGRDPYTLAANEHDARSAREAPWTRDPDTRQWSREVSLIVDYRHNSAVYEKHLAEASPQRAAELEAASQSLIAQNAAQTPVALAARFQAAYERNDWSRYGALPEGVADALQHPGRIVGSDGRLYERNPQGQWTHDGLLWDSQAQANLKTELEATYRQQQANAGIPTLETVRVTPMREHEAAQPMPASPAPTPQPVRSEASVIPTTQPQAQTAPPPVPEHLRDFRHSDHPLHYRYTQTLAAVHALEDQRGMPHGRNSEQLAAALLAKLDTTPLAGEKDGRAHFGPVGSVELRGQGAATEAVVVERRDYYHLPARQLGVPVDQALRPVEHTAAAWARQKMPHLYAPAEASQAQTARPVPEQLPAYDPRHPEHAGHRGYQQLRGQVADTYAKAGMALSEDQLERATAAVALSNRQKALPQVDLLVLLPDRASGTLGPDSPLVAQYGDGNAAVPLRSETTAQQMQRPAEETYQQLQQVDQQLALEQRQREQQREQAQAYGSGITMA